MIMTQVCVAPHTICWQIFFHHHIYAHLFTTQHTQSNIGLGPNQPGGPDSSLSQPNTPQGQGQAGGGQGADGQGQGPNHGNYQVPGGHLVPMYQQPPLQNGQGGVFQCVYLRFFKSCLTFSWVICLIGLL